MKKEQYFWMLGERYKVIAARGASITARKAGGNALYWIIEDDIQ